VNPARLAQMLGRLEGARIPGGCDHCNAYQTAAPLRAGVWRLTVHHDQDCAWMRSRQESKIA